MKGGKLVPAPQPTRTPHWHSLPPAHPPLEGTPGGRDPPAPVRRQCKGRTAETSPGRLRAAPGSCTPWGGALGGVFFTKAVLRSFFSIRDPVMEVRTAPCPATAQLGQTVPWRRTCFGSRQGAHILLPRGGPDPDSGVCCNGSPAWVWSPRGLILPARCALPPQHHCAGSAILKRELW